MASSVFYYFSCGNDNDVVGCFLSSFAIRSLALSFVSRRLARFLACFWAASSGSWPYYLSNGTIFRFQPFITPGSSSVLYEPIYNLLALPNFIQSSLSWSSQLTPFSLATKTFKFLLKTIESIQSACLRYRFPAFLPHAGIRASSPPNIG